MEIFHYKGGNKTKLGFRFCSWWQGGSPFQKKHFLLAVHTRGRQILILPEVKKCHVNHVISPFLISLWFVCLPFYFPPVCIF